MEASYFNAPGITAWQGLRSYKNGLFLFSGTAGVNGIFNIGPIEYNPNNNLIVKYPNTYSTSVYGPNLVFGDTFRLVGSYRLKNTDGVYGFVFQGKSTDLNNPKFYSTVVTGGKFTYVHSTMGDLAVGNYDNPEEYGNYDLPLGPGNAFIYNVITKNFVNIRYPNAKTTTAYGIWNNGCGKYTICGGYALAPKSIKEFVSDDGQIFKPIGSGYLVDYDARTETFSNWTSFEYPKGVNFETHFEGISRGKNGTYQLSATSIQLGLDVPLVKGSWVEVSRDKKVLKWIDLNYNNDPTKQVTNNSVAGNNVVGFVLEDPIIPYQAIIG